MHHYRTITPPRHRNPRTATLYSRPAWLVAALAGGPSLLIGCAGAALLVRAGRALAQAGDDALEVFE